MRSIVVTSIGGDELVATRHAARDPRAASDVGVLVLSFGPRPRSGSGDVAVHAADALAARGHVVLRVDLPGLGDSPGELPAREEPFFQHLQVGGHGELVRRLVAELAAQERVPRWVLLGMCASTWTALHASEAPHVAGLVLLEPELRTTPSAPREAASSRWVHALAERSRRAGSRAAWLRLARGERPVGAILRRLVPERALRLHGLPADAHAPLVELWMRTARRGMPALIASARGGWREAYVLALRERLAREGGGASFRHASIPHTNHVFTSPGARGAVIDAMVQWMQSQLDGTPCGARDDARPGAGGSP